jgi:mRNA interferase RelE/StbE
LTERYSVEFSQAAARTLRKLEPPIRARIVAALGLLRDIPRPPAARALVGRPGTLQVRVGDCRIVYSVEDGRLLVLVLAIGHRKDVYRVR